MVTSEFVEGQDVNSTAQLVFEKILENYEKKVAEVNKLEKLGITFARI